MLRKLGIGPRLALAFALVIVAIGIASALVVSNIRQTEFRVERIASYNLVKMRATLTLLDAARALDNDAAAIAAAKDAARIAPVERAVAERRTAFDKSMATLAELHKITRKPEEEAPLLAAIREHSGKLFDAIAKLGEAGKQGKADEATRLLDAEVAAPAASLLAAVKAYSEFIDHRMVLHVENIHLDNRAALIALLAGNAVALILTALIGWRTTRSITVPVARLVGTAERIADGDLTETVAVDANDEIGKLQAAMKTMSDSLGQAITQVRVGASQLVDAAAGLSSAASQVRSGSEFQSEAASGMAAALEEMSTSISHVSDLSDDARQNSSKSRDVARAGNSTIGSMVGEIERVARTIEESAASATALGRESEKISTIIHVIKDVADQTNLLALNAAIEAARAGEQGRGFAVVADEVRKLAEKTTHSAQEITNMVAALQASANEMAARMDGTVGGVRQGLAYAQRAGGAIGEIDAGAESVVGMIDNVSVALREQASASHDIGNRVEKIVQMIEENTSAVGSVAQSAGELDALSRALNGSVEHFKLRG
ncbi:MAG: HAMP domain-containing protein [Sterolibacteriaceae bacterium]|nr:HAMP domain-containing protein [Candidatus Methylophosphatis haderslevensis]